MALESLGLDAILLEAARLQSLDADAPRPISDYTELTKRIAEYNATFGLGVDLSQDDYLAQGIKLCRAFHRKWNTEYQTPESRQTELGRKFAFLAPTVPNEEFLIVYPEKLQLSLAGEGNPEAIAKKLRAALIAAQEPDQRVLLKQKTAARLTGLSQSLAEEQKRLAILQAQNTLTQSAIRFINRGAEYIAGFFSGPQYIPHAEKIAKSQASIQEWKNEIARNQKLADELGVNVGANQEAALPATTHKLAARRTTISSTALQLAGIAASFMVVFTAYAGYKLKLGKLLQSSDDRPTAKAVEAPKAPANQAGPKPSSTTPSIPAKPAQAPALKANAANTPPVPPVKPTSSYGTNNNGMGSFGQNPGGVGPTVTTLPARSGSSAPPLTRPTSERGSN